jgi:hypothetical protein
VHRKRILARHEGKVQRRSSIIVQMTCGGFSEEEYFDRKRLDDNQEATLSYLILFYSVLCHKLPSKYLSDIVFHVLLPDTQSSLL